MRTLVSFVLLFGLASWGFLYSQVQSFTLEKMTADNLNQLELFAEIHTQARIYEVEWSEDSQFLAIADSQCVYIYRRVGLLEYRRRCDPTNHGIYVMDMEFMPNQATLVLGWSVHGGSTSLVEIWNFEKDEVIWQKAGYLDGIRSLALGYDGELLVVGGGDDRWGTRSGYQSAMMWHWNINIGLIPTMQVDAVNILQFSPDNRFILQGDSQGRLFLYELAINEYASAIYHYVQSVEFISNNRFVALTSEQIELWEIREEPEVHMAYVEGIRYNNPISAVVGDENLKGMAVWSTDDYQILAVGDIRTQQPLFEINLKNNPNGYFLSYVNSFSPDSEILALHVSENTVQLWGVLDE